MSYSKYIHHGAQVWVRDDLKGQHRNYCLCYQCDKFLPNNPRNCPIAQALFKLNVKHALTTPVFECPEFILKEG